MDIPSAETLSSIPRNQCPELVIKTNHSTCVVFQKVRGPFFKSLASCEPEGCIRCRFRIGKILK